MTPRRADRAAQAGAPQARPRDAAAGPGADRRRELRQQRRQERLRNLWRVLVLSAAAAGLGYGLLREGWTLRSPEQVEVSGSRQVSREQVIREGRLRFPLQLLSVQPRGLAARLAAALPVEKVQVSRLMLPPRLRIDLVDREAVARAERRTGKGLEQGFVDRLGNWMSSRQQLGTATPQRPLVWVRGWQERLRPPLALVLARRNELGSPLQAVRFEPDGNLWLVTAALGEVRLGPPDARLNERLDVLEHLSSRLPGRVRGTTVRSIDLSDPDKPELGLRTPAAPPQRGAGGTGVD